MFFYPSLKNTIVDTFFILFIAAIGTATYFGIDMIMSKTISVSQIKEAAQEAYEQFKDNTVGKNAKMIQEYIQNQLEEDLANDQISLKEYMDPFTGSKRE